MNEAMIRLDCYVQAHVLGEIAEPPASPLPGQCWLVGSGASGAWAGADGSIAGWTGHAWQLCEPVPGMAVWDGSAGQRLVFDDAWRRPANPALPSGGATIDAEARATLDALIDALRQGGILPRS